MRGSVGSVYIWASVFLVSSAVLYRISVLVSSLGLLLSHSFGSEFFGSAVHSRFCYWSDCQHYKQTRLLALNDERKAGDAVTSCS